MAFLWPHYLWLMLALPLLLERLRIRPFGPVLNGCLGAGSGAR